MEQLNCCRNAGLALARSRCWGQAELGVAWEAEQGVAKEARD
jgi:hypothetical protein